MAPAWVAQSLADILGLDLETINQVIIPDLEGYTSEVRLRGQLQDFLGPTSAARAFADRYAAHRFPPLPGASTAQPGPSAPRIIQPTPRYASASVANERSHSQTSPDLKDFIRADLSIKKKKKNTAALAVAASQSPAPRTPSATLPEELESAFGAGGKVYQKNRDDNLFPSRGNSARGGTRTAGSGAHTPHRVGGAVTIMESTKPAKEKGKAKEEKVWDLPKSEETKRLEGIVEGLRQMQAGMGKGAPVNTPPCFCQARLHDLSRYTPQCAACGLILCSLQPAHAPCPSCARPTLSPPGLARLILRVEGDIAAQIAREQDERDAAERERKARLLAQSGGGAFPTLPGGARKLQSTADAARKVLTIKSGQGKSKGRGKATLTTTTYTAVATPPTSSKEPMAPETMPRPRSPPLNLSKRAKEAAKAHEWCFEQDRPWGDLKSERRSETWTYVERLVIEQPNEEGMGRGRKAKSKGLGANGRPVVGAAR
ncbi:hypothetical protein CcaverHIS002_0401350 [Cutaneotrichosporon cavernicola]|uniref:TRIP4/RQT4 C2HC5-type zinc finger domain-containing protein n=1 Tax=Cutaneotrichosporon cavernicola TaxID=279322 RepID=A0AA48L3I9_9TREE|nr:uncharacterized protein CcaverHIS019_0401310 [Cutaneotrichosporon cavernicola]BEI83531.1 hypothetical protein CcaverHIS002_0401350 [Cutaneotrichosporon cavernicola]BEI91311.1 hypothetical protein CcaverHIS019_0401310 [Cutaneotrichosporon cavernicola]BEJ06858.1 hypothetical protein CcaverHIS641_0401270 [Cutaneotrichosporon cavernicola]